MSLTRSKKIMIGCAIGAALLLLIASAIRPLAYATLALVAIGAGASAVSNYRGKKSDGR